jgi:hypothetical protein
MLAQWLRSLYRPLAVSGRPNREARKSKWPSYRLSGEVLEDRVAPAVGATFVGGLLTVTLGAANDTATLTGTLAAGTTINVTGTGGFNTTYGPAATGATAVTAITVQDGGSNAGQSVTLASSGTSAIIMSGAITISGIETVTLGTSTTLQANSLVENDPGTTSAATTVTLNTNVTTNGGGQTYHGNVVVPINGTTLTDNGSGITIGDNVRQNVLLLGPNSSSATNSLNVNGPLTLGSTTTLVTTVASTTQFGFVFSSGQVTVNGGTLDLVIPNGVTIQPQQQVPVIQSNKHNGITGTFATVVTLSTIQATQQIQVAASGPYVISLVVVLNPQQQSQPTTIGGLVVNPNPVVAGQSATFIVTVTSTLGTPTGTVSFFDNGTLLGSAPLNAAGQASFTTTLSAAGSHSITATFVSTTGQQVSTPTGVGVSVLPGTPSSSTHFIVATAGPGGGPLVNVYDASTGNLITSLNAFAPIFTGGVRIAVADVNGDGTPDIICGAGPGGGPEVSVFDGKTFQRFMDFLALPPQFAGGVWVAAGNITTSSYADIVVSADAGGGPQVAIFDGKSGAEITSFYATAPQFTGGIRIACADLNGDGFADVIAAAGPGGGPQVTIFNGKTLSLLTAFYALPPTFTGGMYVAAGDVNGDGKADIIVGAEKGGGPEVNVFNGAAVAPGVMPPSLYAFYALPPQFTGGVRVGYSSAFEGHESILSVAGPGGGPQLSIFDGVSQTDLDSFYAFAPTFGGGVYVGGN